MKTDKTFGLAAAVWAAFVCTMAVTASAAEGDIWSIRRTAGGDHGTETLSMADKPLRAKQTVYFKFRLLNRDPQANIEAYAAAHGLSPNAAHASADTWNNMWRLLPKNPSSGKVATDVIDMVNATNFPAKVGVWVSGRCQWADIERVDLAPDNWDYTDIICSYTAQPGDFGLLTLAAGSEDRPVEAAAEDTGASAYLLRNSRYWGFFDSLTKTNACNLWLTSLQEANVASYVTFPNDDSPRWVADRDMSQAGIYVKTVDFDDATFNADGVWRRIAAGGTSAYISNGNVKRAPTLSIDLGSVATDHTVTLYAWVDDPDVAYMKNGTEYDFATDGVSVTRRVVPITITPTDGETKEIPGGIFAREGATNKTATLYLSATPTNIFRAGVLITNFVTQTILVGPPEPPSLVVLAQGAADYTAEATSPAEIVPITVAFEGVSAYTNALTVTVTAEMAASASTNTPDMFVGLSTSPSGDPNGGTNVTVTIDEGFSSAIVYAYVKRANIDDTTAAEKGIRFTATVDAAAEAFFSGGIVPAKLHIKKGEDAPNISSPLEGASYPHVPGGTDYTFRIAVDDAYGETTSDARYTVYWSNSGNGIYTAYTNLTLSAGELAVTARYMTGGTFDTQFYVVNQDGFESPVRTVSVQVDEPKVVTLAADRASRRYVEGETATVTLTLSEPFTTAGVGYLFLVPQDADSSNLVDCVQFETGVPIQAGSTVPDTPPEITFLDGKPSTLQYTAVLRSHQNIAEGDSIGGFASRLLVLSVSNVVPRVTSVSMGGTPLSVNGGQIEAKAAKGVAMDFRVERVDEPSALDLTNGNFMTEWKFFENGSMLSNVVVTGSPYATPVPYAFHNSGTNKVTVRVKDKDMTQYADEEFTFYVETLGTPTISLTPYRGSRTFLESETGSENGSIYVRLNMAPSEPITVKVDVSHVNPSDTTMLPVLSTHYVNFDSGETEGSFFLQELDGTDNSDTSGFAFTAAVTNQTTAPNSGGKTWAEYYTFDRNGFWIRVLDEAPAIAGMNDNTVTNIATLNVPYAITWTVSDVMADMTNGLTASWSVPGEGTFDYPITNATGRSHTDTFTVTFTKQGNTYRRVVLTVRDKDNKSASREYIFQVDPQKPVAVIPLGPEEKGQTTLSQKYARQPGKGAGRVWADGALSKIESFMQTWNYEPLNTAAFVFGYGYRAGEVDNGMLQPVASLQSGTSVAISPMGNRASSAPWYTADATRDSFFYCWIGTGDDGDDGSSSSEGVHLGPIAPAVGTNALASSGRQKVTLASDANDEENPSYPTVTVEAVFSREWHEKDNVGDINGDGIPDVFAVNYDWKGGLLFEAAGGTLEEGGDLINLHDWNGDSVSTEIGQTASGETGDFLPSMTSSGNGSLIPNIQSNWALYGRPFTAYLELRGFGDGLNFRRDDSDTQGPRTTGEWIGERDFTDVESNVWVTVYGGDENWTPENRTDPTVDDTDGDGLPDGYEYYFWYYAYVGSPTTGERLTGERFRLEELAVGTKIESDEIARLFNPNVASDTPINERDSDGDGLTDLEEFALGTNPLHWDTDGDGLSDYWEVLRGLNPLVAEAADSNPDGDFMARAEIGTDYAVISFTNADGRTMMYALPADGAGLVDAADLTVNAAATNGAVGIPVFRYGKSGAPVVPTSRGSWTRNGPLSSVAGSSYGATYYEYSCTEKPTAVKPIDWTGLDDIANVTVQVGQTLIVIHDQVMAEFGFDPRTAWYKSSSNRVNGRWNATEGEAVNTVPYTTFDEYMLLKYRYMTAQQDGNAADILPGFVKNNPTDSGDRTYNLDRDLKALKAKEDTLGNIFLCGTTNPNVPFSKTYTEESATEYADENHGADTNEDGVPDGWTLYVGFNPNRGARNNEKKFDGTGMSLAEQFAGTDSSAAYAGVASVATNLPSTTGSCIEGWLNKFWPVNPWNGDTDGDYIRDDIEGGRWSGVYKYGQTVGFNYSFTFVYDETDGVKPTVSSTTHCVRGGGMNPCTVDTDGDRLPDTWEMCYAGLLFQPDGTPYVDNHNPQARTDLGDQALELIRRGDNLKSGATAVGYYIAGGMDATDPNDAYGYPLDARTGTYRDVDFDHDGLQNFQEYLVQALRHLRYDDAMTPLMGRTMPDGTPASEKFLGFLKMNYMDGETFRADAVAAGFTAFTAADYFRTLGYFARPPRAWDPAAVSGLTKDVSDYDGETGGYRVMLPPTALLQGGESLRAFGYASTDPRLWDTDGDNMDDYYELFHGLNPLLGSVKDATDGRVIQGDVICAAYGNNPLNISFWNNAWMGWPGPLGMPDWLGSGANTFFDPLKYPWMMGTPEADADGDGIRNAEEALAVNMTSPQPTHTDPTPLWMTDSTAPNLASYTAQYYQKDKELDLYWNFSPGTRQTQDGATEAFLFSFEENEGYDTDGDWIADSDEQIQTATARSDAQNFTDPDRRQAIWFPGEKSAAVSRTGSFHRLNWQSYDTFRQFTVEAWVKPEALGREQVILERSAVYGASTLSNNLAQVRANFRIGITADGFLYGSYDSSDAVASGTAGQTATVLGGKLTDAWTHVALSYDGTALKLYMNGYLVKREPTGLIPANGLIDFVQEALPGMGNFPVLGNGYMSVPCAVVLGARALDKAAFDVSRDTTWGHFGDFYAGYLDEVRVWDGARTAGDIAADMNKRYAFADVAAQRDTVYAAWAGGATRNDNDGRDTLPPELVMHYSFQTLPGATEAADVAWEPSGFSKNVRDLCKVEGYNVPGDIYCGWWYSAKNVRSTVYRNWRLVPWIQNTVGHLPPLDGSTVDSEYWSMWYGGLTAASEVGVDGIVFPNTATPYPYVLFQADRYYHQQNLLRKKSLGLIADNVATKYDFDLRTAVVGTSDLVPLGGAFAKRTEEMWDGQGAADAWTMTKRDTNANGIPDWWEAVAKGSYGAADGFGWDSVVTCDGREMTAREAYLRDLQRGMLPDGSVNGTFASDVSGVSTDSIPTWWRNLVGLTGTDADDDDGDGLSNYMEYLLSEGDTNAYPRVRVNPQSAFTFADSLGQIVPDYFLRTEWQPGVTNYLGAMMTDHDFMENAWEDRFDVNFVSRAVYDAWKDADDDGWSNFAEARAGSDPSRQNAVGVDGYQIAGHPVPEITLSVNMADGSTFSPEQAVIVRAYADGEIEKTPSAQWSVTADESSTRFLGVNSGRKMSLTLGPGSVKQGSVALQFKSPVWYTHTVIYRNGVLVDRSSVYSTMSDWRHAAVDVPLSTNSNQGVLFWTGSTDNRIGTINYETGEVEIDFALCGSGARTIVSDTTGSVDDDVVRIEVAQEYPSDEAWFRITWEDTMVAGNTRQTLRLAEPEAAVTGVSGGMLREGKNTFVAFVDEDGDGTYTPGEPYGVATDVDVGWFGVACAIELSRTAPQMARVQLSGAGETRVRVVRALLNGAAAAEEALIDRVIDVTAHPLLTEADLLAAGEPDLDWGTLLNAWLAAGNANVAGLTNATYAVLTGDDAATVTNSEGQVVDVQGTVFNVRFEAGLQQTAAAPVAPLGGRIYSGSPTFRWTHANSISKDYPAFRLRVWGADGETLVYDSGVRQAPSRDSKGVYEWTAPIYAGMVTPQGVVFETGTDYRWTVSMLDAKFTVPNGAETKGDFTLACTGDIRDGYGYGSIDVAVKYFGPLAEVLPTDVTQFTNLVRVQAFESPDFTGVPAGEAFVTNVADIASISNLTVNARILGLKPGSYYVRAFIDTDADLVWSRWESWGYCNYVGTDAEYVYTPRAVTVAAGSAVPVATVYMEVADTNNNGEPDDWEWNERGALGATAIGISAGGSFDLPEDGGALLDPAQGLDVLDLTLKPAPSEPVTLKLTLESLTGDVANLPAFADTNGVAMACETNGAGAVTVYLTDVTETAVRVRLLGMDGTAGSTYLVTATATNAVDRYRPGEFRLAVTNIAPVITFAGAVTNDSPTNAVMLAMGETVRIPVSVDDVAADLAAGLNVYWTGEGLASLDAFGTPGAAVLTPNGDTVVTNGVALTTNRVEGTFSFVFSGGASGLRSATLVAEDKDGGVSTRAFWYHVLAPQDDYDNDGLSNQAEWNAIAAGLLPEGAYTNACSDGVTPDYWRTVTVDGVRRYIGEIFSDHDHMDDAWEDAYGIAYVNSAIWDAANDADGDGWSNWSEAAALTDPSLERSLSLVSAGGDEDQAVPAHPVPTVRVKAVYEGASSAFNGALVVKAWHGSTLSGMPDAKWTVSGPSDASASCSRFLGLNPNRKVRFNLGPGMVAEQHCSLTFFDPHCHHVNMQSGEVEYYTIDSSHWHSCDADDPTVRPNGLTSAAFGGGYVDYRTGEVELDFTKFQDTDFTIAISKDEVAHVNLSRSFVRVNWMSRVVSTGTTREMCLSLADEDASTRGFLREGETTFVAFADANGNGEWDEGEPFGVTRGVQVGWDEVSEVAIELTDDADGMRFAIDGEGRQRVRVVRTAINGQTCPPRTVWSRTVDLNVRNWFTEADFVKSGTFDFDWTYLCDDAAARLGLDPSDIQSATYQVYGGTSADEAVYSFTRVFDGTRIAPVAVSPSESDAYAVYTAQPTFRWSGAGSVTAFQLQIAKDADFSEVVWDSGTNFLAAGRSYAAPAYVGAELEDGTAYYWRVVEYSAQYREAAGFWSAPAKFETRVNTRAYGRSTGYGDLALDVRYYGPATNEASSVVVAVYPTADFTGMPVARARLGGGISVAALTNDLSAVTSLEGWWTPVTNVMFSGIAPGSYYAMAFIDLDGDGVRAAYEPWGYVTTDRGFSHPAPLLVDAYAAVPPSAVIVMEDTDLNGDDVPDCLQDVALFAAAASGGTGTVADVDSDGDGLSDFEEDEQGTDPTMWDSDGDGMPDGWEMRFAGTDPVTADGDYVVANDVMAYVVTNLTAITVWDGADPLSATNFYAVMDAEVNVKIGDDASSLANLRSVYDYGGRYGLGMTASATGRVYAVAENTEVALVHAQVYEFFGFDPTTANPAAVEQEGTNYFYGANTKPFTALDKYLVCRYLEKAYGLADETAMNTNRTWSSFTLKPGDTDNNKDGIPDGWELYVMFGTDGTAASLAEARISPFAEIGGVAAADYVRDAANTPDGGGLAIIDEFAGGIAVTDPWNVDSDNDGITDLLASQYGLGGGRAGEDADNDGLSNYMEYLAATAGYLPNGAYTNRFSNGQLVPDYFLPGADGKYLGFMYGDHDFMDDWWEAQFDSDMISGFAFDPWDDPDDDGWSNWAEARAGTNPTSQNVSGVDGYSEFEHPVPNVAVTLVQEEGTIDAPVYLTAYPDGKIDEMPDAKWTIGGDATSERYLGANPRVAQTVTLGPCEPGSVRIAMKTSVYFNHTEVLKNRVLQRHDISYSLMSEWIGIISDKPRTGDSALAMGDLIWAGMLNTPVGWINYRTGETYIDYSLFPDAEFVSESTETETVNKSNAEGGDDGADVITTSKYREYPTDGAWFRATWQSVIPSGTWRRTVYLGTPEPAELGVARGMLREGKTTFTAFLDENKDGVWTPGEPFGVVRGVDVGWFGTSCEIELTRTSAQVVRLNLAEAAGSTDFAAADAITDRKVVGAPTAGNLASGLVVTSDLSTKLVRVRILRTLVNGMRQTTDNAELATTATFDGLVFDRYVDVSTHSLLTEADILATDAPALDWGTLTNVWTGAGYDISLLTNATYRVVLGEDSDVLEDGNGLPLLFVNKFEGGREQTLAEPVAPMGDVSAARPTFRWTHANKIGKAYPAFRLRVWDEANGLVYDSGVLQAPPRTDEGVYEWTAPLCAGMVTSEGKVFSSTGRYRWAVSMLDEKFTEPNESELVRMFQMQATGAVVGTDSAYGAMDVVVRYYGPAATTADGPALTNVIRVQAFTTPDFTGDPAGETFVTNVADIASTTDLTANARILGLKAGSYYVRAFIDTDGDGAWSRWETWGYCNNVGTDELFLYTPRAVTVSVGMQPQTAVVFMEDMDTNGNGEPDAREYDEQGSIGSSAIGIIAPPGAQGVLETAEDAKLALVLKPTPASLQTNVTLRLTLTCEAGHTATLPRLAMPGLRLDSEDYGGDVVVARTYVIENVTDGNISLDLSDLDGTAGSEFRLVVSSDLPDVYWPGSTSFSVANVPPAILGAEGDSAPEVVNIGDEFTIHLSVDDVAADLAAGLNVYWTGEGLVCLDGTASVERNGLGVLVTNGVSLVTNKLDKTFRLSFEGGSSGRRSATLVAEDKDGGVSTRTFWYYVIAGQDDFDNDGLANWIENLIKDDFSAKYPGLEFPAVSYTNMYSAAGQAVPDYFLRVGRTYLGFMYGDHDFMDDWWEDLFDSGYVSRYAFDAWDDPDDDGWSNWAEARAGTDPTRVAVGLPDAEQLSESPMPVIRLKATYPNVKASAISANLVVQAYGARETSENGAPNAVWSVPTAEAQSSVRYLGVNPGGSMSLNLGPGSVVPGSVTVEFRDLNALSHSADGTNVWMAVSETPWVQGLGESVVGEGVGALVRTLGEPAVGTIDYKSGDVTLDLSRMQDYLYESEGAFGFWEPSASNDWTRLDLSQSYMRVGWSAKTVSSEDASHGRIWETSLSVPNVSGRLHEGKTMFVVFADLDANGLWSPGEPYGVATDIDVGWSGTSVEVELTDISSQVLRMDLAKLVEARERTSADEATDRGVLGHYAYYPNTATTFVGTNDMANVLVRVRIVRSWFNGDNTNAVKVARANGTVFDGTFDLRGRPCMTEADLRAKGLLDLDWGNLTAAYRLFEGRNTAEVAIVTNVAYRVILGGGTDSGAYNVLDNLMPLVFYNAFEYGTAQTRAEPVSPAGGVVYAGQPTFRWTHEARDASGRKIKDYPAFRLRIWKADGTTLVYDSGVRPAPARSVVDGSYSWTAPIYANMVTPQGQIFATTNNYTWAVSMLDAKFTAPNATETKSGFRLEASGALGTISDYGAIKTCVRYYGPAGVSADARALTNIVRVQAFASPDFTGTPAGEAYVTNVSDIASITDATTPNALILGVKPGTYYLRAFVDSDGDGVWSRWETWGYANNVGTDAKSLYAPRAVNVEVGKSAPNATVFMEDMDTDRDHLPDAKEWHDSASLATRGAPAGNTFFTRVNPTFAKSVPAYLLGATAQAANVPVTLMGLGAPTVERALLMSSSAAVEALAASAVQVRISSFSLADGVSLKVSSNIAPGNYGAIVVDENDTVDLYLVATKTPDFADAVETKIKAVTITANAETGAVVTADELKAVIDAAGFGDAAFFKIKLVKQE